MDSFIDSMSQEHIVNVNQSSNSLTTEHGMSNDVINDIRRAIEQYHNPVAYYLSFDLDQPGAR